MIQDKSFGNKKICFVVMGYGLKKDPDSGETLDLNKTFFNIIKPVVKKLGFECVRCDEVSNSGLIDKVMYEYIWNADLVIADISTLNPNAMYELGVRHALRPSSTVIIAEERTNFSFDVGHNSIFRYKHLGVDIGVTEAKRCIKELTNHIKGILDKNEVDSPYENVELTEQQEGILRISWNILNNFKLLPGLDNHNDFHSDVAVDWIEKVLNLAKENKRVCVTKICLGKLFFYTPRDNSSQLWIEKSIADSWLIKASELESVGFYNFAQTAKDIAKTYNSFASYNYME